MNKKILPYVLYGVPVLIGAYIIYDYFKRKKRTNQSIIQDKMKEVEISPEKQNDTTIATKYITKDSLPFKLGVKSSYVGAIQRELGIVDDNLYGNATYNAVVKFQKQKRLTADGIVGKNTWKALFGVDFPRTGEIPQYPPMTDADMPKFDPFKIR